MKNFVNELNHRKYPHVNCVLFIVYGMAVLFLISCVCLFVLVSSSFAYDYVDIYQQNGCIGKVETWSKMYAAQGGDCTNQSSVDLARTGAQNYLNGHAWGSSCEVTVNYDTVTPNCGVVKGIICCSQEDTDFISNTSKTIGRSAVITNIPVGSEDEAAKLYAQAYWDSTADSSMTNKIKTSSAVGYSYTSDIDPSGSTSAVSVVAWDRALFTNAGENPVSITDLGGGIGSGSGSGSLNQAGVQAGMEAALSTMGISQANIQAAVQAGVIGAGFTFDANGGLRVSGISGGGGSTGGLTAGELDSALSNLTADNSGAIANPVPLSTDRTDGVYLGALDSFKDSVGESFRQFTENMMGTGIVSSINGFFGGVPESGGVVPVVQMNTTNLGNHTFSFDKWSSYLNALSIVFKVVFTSIAVRIVAINGV